MSALSRRLHHCISIAILRCMRTTITLEDDVAAAIEQLRRTEGRSLRDVLNELLRAGLARTRVDMAEQPPYRTRAVSLGECRLQNVDNISEVLALAEDEDYR
jgi:hypothetical protein